ncbi:MAG TPA: xanthine dehydrogenase family protein subunit M, partial [Variovorax sp.]|nr:xanthine dehydrogenase family protein subunit M [Variovorax sp.]
LGGVAHKPWRATRAEALLRGASATAATFEAAARAELADARGLGHNTFKIDLARRVVVAVLGQLAGDAS